MQSESDNNLLLNLINIKLDILIEDKNSINNIDIIEYAGEGDIENLKKILNIPNINIDIEGYFGETALYAAALYGEAECVELLIKAGADINATCRIGFTILYQAVCSSSKECVELLIKAGADLENPDDIESRSVLQWSIISNETECVELLINAGANINYQEQNGDTALIAAVEEKNIEIVKLLIKNGADINIQNEDGYTALFSVVFYNTDTEIVKLLIKNGADINIKNNDGNTVLFSAVQEKNIKIVKLLIKNGADINIKNDKGETALDICYDDEIKELLIKSKVNNSLNDDKLNKKNIEDLINKLKHLL